MPHALIIDQNRIVSRAIRNCLEQMGFNSFDHAWREDCAIEAARRRAPDLVVIGDEIAVGSPLEAARTISTEIGVPVLLITGDAERLRQQEQLGCKFEGPFLLNEIEEAVALAGCSETAV